MALSSNVSGRGHDTGVIHVMLPSTFRRWPCRALLHSTETVLCAFSQTIQEVLLIAESSLNSSSFFCSSSLCLRCLLLCCFCRLCAPRIMMKGQGYTERGFSDCTVTQAIHCWCGGGEEEEEEEVVSEENIEIFCLNYWMQATSCIFTGLH